MWNNPLKYTDPSGEWFVPVLFALVGAYIGGVSSNNGELNPTEWDYKDPATWRSMIFGGIMGAAGGYWVVNPTAFSLNVAINTPWLQVGVGVTGVTASTGSGTDWEFDFQWTTSSGGYGNLDLGEPITFEDVVYGSNQQTNFYTGGCVDTSPEYDPTMAYLPGGVWLPEVTVRWDGFYGTGRVRGESPYWWGYTNAMANPLTQARMMNQGVEVMYATLALPVTLIGAGELFAFSYAGISSIPSRGFIGRFGYEFGKHGPHHKFPYIGKYPHYQLDIWRKGIKGSRINIYRIPWRW